MKVGASRLKQCLNFLKMGALKVYHGFYENILFINVIFGFWK